jgi:gluconokinase
VLEDLVTVAKVDRLVAAGTALTASRVWPQILADVIGCSVAVPREPELTSRGAAAIGFELLGEQSAAAPAVARTYHPDKRAHAVYLAAAERQRRLLRALC